MISVVMISDFSKFRVETDVYFDIVEIVLKFEIHNHCEKGLISHFGYLRANELEMLHEGMSRPRRPILTPVTFRSVMRVEGNEFVLKNAFVGVSNDLYVFIVITKL